jgi:hypothetical protein
MQQTSRWLTFVVVITLVCGAGDVAGAGQGAKVDVTGDWIFTVESALGKSNPNLTFKQNGDKLTGQYSSELMGQTELTGTVKGQAIEFTVSATVQGMPIELKYTGTVESRDSMKGTLTAGELGGGTFTAARKEK